MTNQPKLTLGEPGMNSKMICGVEDLPIGPHSEDQCNSDLGTTALASKIPTFLLECQWAL